MVEELRLKPKVEKTLETSESLKSILDFDFSGQRVRGRIEELDYLKQRKKSNRARFGKLVTDVKVS